MIDRLLSLLRDPQPEKRSPDISLACAVLLTEVMHADHTLEAAEAAALRDVIHRLFGLTDAAADDLLSRASEQVRNANDLFRFTRVINETFSDSEKYRLIHGLWQVAYSDAQLDKYEEHMIRKVADLLYVSHSDFIRARNEARDGKPAHL